MANTPIPDHPLIGTTAVYRPDLPSQTDQPITPGLVCRVGDYVYIQSVFDDWNGVQGLRMHYVWVYATETYTHLSARELGME